MVHRARGALHTLFDRGIGVMLIMRGPGGFLGGKVSDALVSHLDVFPTLCDLLEIPEPEWLQGRSVMPLVRGDATQVRDALFVEKTFHVAYEPERAVAPRAGSTSAASTRPTGLRCSRTATTGRASRS